MPPLAALKVLLSLAVTKFKPNEKGVLCEDPEQEVLGFLDVKRVHFCSEATRGIFVELPAEAGYPEGMVGKLLRSMYGCRDAGLNWEMCVAKVMKKLGFIQGASSPCVYLHPTRGIKTVVHGDDFTSLGKMVDVRWLHESLQKEWSCTIRGILGPPGFPGTTSSIVILNRIVTWHENGISWEPDPRHADIIVKTLLPTSGKRNITTPCIRVKISEQPEDEEHDHLPQEEAKEFISLAMRANYLGQDRPDLQFACRELAKGMSQPQNHHWVALRRLARYLEYKPRLPTCPSVQESRQDLGSLGMV